MKRTAFLAMMSTFLLLMAISAQGQPSFGQFSANDYSLGSFRSPDALNSQQPG